MEVNTFSKVSAEFFGTMVLVLMGCGSAAIAGANGSSVIAPVIGSITECGCLA